MSALSLLNFLHARKLRGLACWLCSAGYFLKGFGWVPVKYYKPLRAYGFRVNGITYMSSGPGWAYSYDYLYRQLADGFCRYYIPREGDCVVDLGAGLGEESTIFAQLVGNEGQVFSIEANPTVFSALAFSRNENGFSRMKALNLAVYCEDGEVQIEDDAENYLSNTINTGAGHSTRVKANTFDSIVQDNAIDKIDFLKVNIEGAEQYLIMGMDRSVARIRHLCISCHDFRHVKHQHGDFYMTRQRVMDYLEKNNFETIALKTGNDLIDDYVFARNRRFN
jgi:FkbM family methyltransferase